MLVVTTENVPGKRVHWQDTGERFVDPETGYTTAVYFDPRTAERHYVAVPPGRRP